MTFQRGNNHAKRLNAEQVLDIRERYTSGQWTQTDLALVFGVSLTTVRNILTGVSWQRMAGSELGQLDKPPSQSHVKISDEVLDASLAKLAGMLKPSEAGQPTSQAAKPSRSCYDIPPPTDDTNPALVDKLTSAIAEARRQDDELGALLDNQGDSHVK